MCVDLPLPSVPSNVMRRPFISRGMAQPEPTILRLLHWIGKRAEEKRDVVRKCTLWSSAPAARGKEARARSKKFAQKDNLRMSQNDWSCRQPQSSHNQNHSTARFHRQTWIT